MKKQLSALLAGIILFLVPSAGAEYRSYQITKGNWWKCFPLDAHNTVAVSWLWEEDSMPDPWYVCWYRDGKLYRELTGNITGESSCARMSTPYPALWDGEHLSLYYCILRGKLKTYRQGTWIPTPDPNCFDVYMADWTENGLENEHALPEAWFDTYDKSDRGILVWRGEKGRTAVCGGKEIVLPDSIPVDLQVNILRILPADEDVYLVKVMDNINCFSQIVCMDHGTERYRVTLPQEEFLPERILLQDKHGGFFCLNGYRPAGYEPEYLVHYQEEGRYDRTLALAGDNVVVHACASATNANSGLCTIYGSAVANSRKIYTVFAMTLDGNMNVSNLDVRKIDPAYGNYNPEIMIAPDGTPYVYIECYSGKSLRPVLIPFTKLKKSGKSYGLKLLQEQHAE